METIRLTRRVELPSTFTEIHHELVNPTVMGSLLLHGASLNQIFVAEGHLYAYVSESERYIRVEGIDIG